MASRVLQKCVRDFRSSGLTHIQVATKISNPLKKAKKKPDTTFVEKSAEEIVFRSQQIRKKPEDEAVYRRSEIVANMVKFILV